MQTIWKRCYLGTVGRSLFTDLLQGGVYGSLTVSRRDCARRQAPHSALAPRLSPAPTTHTASGPCEVWCWDITYCPSTVRGQFYYLYMFEDLYSRKIVGYEVHETESGEYAAQLLQRERKSKRLNSSHVRNS